MSRETCSFSPSSSASAPTLYESCIRGSGLGFWKSVDGGVNWTRYPVAASTRQDYYQIEWPPRARRYECGVYADEVLQHYFPPSMAIISNIAAG